MSTITSFINTFIGKLEGRYGEVIRSRYGLDGKEPITLQAIGDRYGITRERVRQIEAVALNALRKDINQSYFKSFIQVALSNLKNAGGVNKEADFIAALQKSMNDRSPENLFKNAAVFLLELSGKFNSHRDNYNNEWHHYWYLTDGDKKRAQSFVGRLVATLKKNKEDIITGKKFSDVLTATARASKLSGIEAESYLAISKKFTMSPFSEIGLSEWSEINPKTARDWAYVVIKKEKKPMHFTELSKVISNHRKGKKTNLQTVHNELIKDNRFVLVGRGLYGLKEFGLIPGTAREIIAHIIKKQGPLSARDIVGHVLKQRSIKESTILINLQNKKYFDCRSDGRYALREV